jgi:cytochrome c oxidase subunit 4|tara:strand:- start:48 stop:356 length:309 start_codon:yes stop_codon:yes gene_type:complete
MATESKESIEHHIQTYIRVFIALGVLTVITVAVSYLNVSFIEAFFIAMTVATIKGSLVLGYFMHLISERQMIIWILVATVTTFIILMFIPLISLTDQVTTWN